MPDEMREPLPSELTRDYFETRRRALLMELRTIERMLGRPPTPTEAQREREARRRETPER